MLLSTANVPKIIDVFLSISPIKSSYGHTMANLEVFSSDSDTKKREESAATATPSPFRTKFQNYLPQAEDIRK